MVVALGKRENVLGILSCREQTQNRLLMYLLYHSAVSDIMFIIDLRDAAWLHQQVLTANHWLKFRQVLSTN